MAHPSNAALVSALDACGELRSQLDGVRLLANEVASEAAASMQALQHAVKSRLTSLISDGEARVLALQSDLRVAKQRSDLARIAVLSTTKRAIGTMKRDVGAVKAQAAALVEATQRDAAAVATAAAAAAAGSATTEAQRIAAVVALTAARAEASAAAEDAASRVARLTRDVTTASTALEASVAARGDEQRAAAVAAAAADNELRSLAGRHAALIRSASGHRADAEARGQALDAAIARTNESAAAAAAATADVSAARAAAAAAARDAAADVAALRAALAASQAGETAAEARASTAEAAASASAATTATLRDLVRQLPTRRALADAARRECVTNGTEWAAWRHGWRERPAGASASPGVCAAGAAAAPPTSAAAGPWGCAAVADTPDEATTPHASRGAALETPPPPPFRVAPSRFAGPPSPPLPPDAAPPPPVLPAELRAAVDEWPLVQRRLDVVYSVADAHTAGAPACGGAGSRDRLACAPSVPLPSSSRAVATLVTDDDAEGESGAGVSGTPPGCVDASDGADAAAAFSCAAYAAELLLPPSAGAKRLRRDSAGAAQVHAAAGLRRRAAPLWQESRGSQVQTDHNLVHGDDAGDVQRDGCESESATAQAWALVMRADAAMCLRAESQ